MKMRWICVSLVLFLTPPLAAKPSLSAETASAIRWHSFEEGMAMSKEENKKVFLYFWAEWCSYCTRMAKETFTDPLIIDPLNNDFVSIKVDYDREQKVASEFSVRGLPSIFFLSESGDRIGSRPGYVSAKDLGSMLNFIHSDSYKTMTLKTFLNKK